MCRPHQRGAWASKPGRVREKKREKGWSHPRPCKKRKGRGVGRGGSVPLGFAKREGKRGVQNGRGHMATAIREKTKVRKKREEYGE
jgi:hypothetical protein